MPAKHNLLEESAKRAKANGVHPFYYLSPRQRKKAWKAQRRADKLAAERMAKQARRDLMTQAINDTF